MEKHQEFSDPDSCLNRALDTEMVFTLLGRDESASNAIRYWAFDRVRRGKNIMSDRQIVGAIEAADRMDAERSTIRGLLKS